MVDSSLLPRTSRQTVTSLSTEPRLPPAAREGRRPTGVGEVYTIRAARCSIFGSAVEIDRHRARSSLSPLEERVMKSMSSMPAKYPVRPTTSGSDPAFSGPGGALAAHEHFERGAKPRRRPRRARPSPLSRLTASAARQGIPSGLVLATPSPRGRPRWLGNSGVMGVGRLRPAVPCGNHASIPSRPSQGVVNSVFRRSFARLVVNLCSSMTSIRRGVLLSVTSILCLRGQTGDIKCLTL